MKDVPFIGRQRKQSELAQTLDRAREGRGQLVLLAGEAGVGKTRLVQEILAKSGLLVLQAGASLGATPPYGPVVAVLRSYLRLDPAGLANLGPLAGYLALLIPELDSASSQSDRSTLFEAIRYSLELIARQQPAAVFLDDLQWSDAATLELLPALAAWVEDLPLLLIGAYRSDEVPRGHPLRQMRAELRRARRLHEVSLEPLDREETAALAAAVLGRPPEPALVAALYDRTQGVPFFVEELATALLSAGWDLGREVVPGEVVPLPQSIRDAVLLRTCGLSHRAQGVMQVAAVTGVEFDLDLVAELVGGDEGLNELADHGLMVETAPGRGAFRHALVREAIYEGTPWPRRRTLHRELAAALEIRGAPAGVLAEHWLVARDLERARRALLQAAEAWCNVHAYRDAARAVRRALELWPERQDEAYRLAVLDRLGQCAELCGEFGEAARAWREVAEAHRASGASQALAEVQRHLAAVYELQGAWEAALEARQQAAEAFAACGMPGEVAAERLAIASHLETAGCYTQALELVQAALADVEQANHVDLKAEALGLEGLLRAELGDTQRGLELVRAGLKLALDLRLTGPAVENYYRLASALDQATDYAAAHDTYLTAIDFCQAEGIPAMGQLCLACIAVVLFQTGEWDQGATICRQVLASNEAPPAAHAVAAGMLGLVSVIKGERGRARRLLLEANAQARRYDIAALELYTSWGLALADELGGNQEAAAAWYRSLLQRWRQTEERHYVILPLRSAATFFAIQGARADASASAQALAEISTAASNSESLAALAHALGECAFLDGDPQRSVLQFNHALELLGRFRAPLALAQTQLRSGVALAAAGQKQTAVERLVEAYRTACRLKARPLALEATRKLADMGERVEHRMGRRAAGELQNAGLSRRELEVLQLVGVGRTNREIALELFLSLRTVDMHVSHILGRLGCRTRTEAVKKAHDLRLLS